MDHVSALGRELRDWTKSRVLVLFRQYIRISITLLRDQTSTNHTAAKRNMMTRRPPSDVDHSYIMACLWVGGGKKNKKSHFR